MMAKVTKAYQIWTGDRIAYVESLPEGNGDYGYTLEASKALNLTDAQAKKYQSYAKKTYGLNGRWGVQSYYIEVVA